MISTRLLLHIGMPKCASTSIQTYLSEYARPRYLGKFLLNPAEGTQNMFATNHLRQVFREIIPYMPESQFITPEVFRSIKETFLDTIAPSEESYIISDELLSGCGFYNFDKMRQPDMLGIIRRLKKLFKEIKILMVVREPTAFFKSYYNQLIRLGYNLHFSQFIAKSLQQTYSVGQYFYLDQFIQQTRSEGIDIEILPFEALKMNNAQIMNQLADFFELNNFNLDHLNQGVSHEDLKTKLRQNLQNLGGVGLQSTLLDSHLSQELLKQQNQTDIYSLPSPLKEQFESNCKNLIAGLETTLNSTIFRSTEQTH